MKKENKSIVKFVSFMSLLCALILIIALYLIPHYAQKITQDDPTKGNYVVKNARALDIGIKNELLICDYPWFVIEYVDEINTAQCYAIKQEKRHDEYLLKESLDKPSVEDYFRELNWSCARITDEGNIYCLKDKSVCLLLEDDGKICNIINMTENN